MPGNAVVYPAPEGAEPSDLYALRVDGREVFVHACPCAGYASFALTGPAEVEIEAQFPIREVKIRPLNRRVEAAVQGNRVRFGLDGPAHLSLEPDGDLSRPLFIFADAPDPDPPSPGDPNVRCFEAGRVHRPGLMTLRDGETVYIEGGAVVQGAVLAEGASDVAVRGRGILDGSLWPDGGKDRGPWLIQFIDCRDIRVEGITAVESPRWTLPLVGCSGARVSGVKIISWLVVRDGIDIVGSRDVVVEDCFIRTADDCVALKATTHIHESGTRDIENVRVRRCVLWNAKPGNALEIGYETRCDAMRDIVFQDCDVIHAEFEGYQSGAVFSIHNCDRATVSDVLYEDIRVEDAREKLIDVKIFYTPRCSRDDRRGHVRNIRFKDIRVVDGPFPVSIIQGCDPDHMIEEVTVEGLTIHGRPIADASAARMVVELTRGLRFTPGVTSDGRILPARPERPVA